MSPRAHPTDLADQLDGLIVTRVWRLADAFERRLTEELTALGLTMAGFRLVGELMRSTDGLRQKELARRIRVSEATVSSAVSKLEAAGLLERTNDPDDPRAWCVRIAERSSLQAGAELLARIEAELVGDASDRKRQQLERTLDELTRRLDAPTESGDVRR